MEWSSDLQSEKQISSKLIFSTKKKLTKIFGKLKKFIYLCCKKNKKGAIV